MLTMSNVTRTLLVSRPETNTNSGIISPMSWRARDVIVIPKWEELIVLRVFGLHAFTSPIILLFNSLSRPSVLLASYLFARARILHISLCNFHHNGPKHMYPGRFHQSPHQPRSSLWRSRKMDRTRREITRSPE